MFSSSFFASTESQRRWRLHMNYKYTPENQDILPCVFQVPDNLRATKPEAYVPQTLGLGPYHHFRPQVQHLSSKKRDALFLVLDAVRSGYRGETAAQSYARFIGSIEEGEGSNDNLEAKIRSCYDQFLDLDEKTLSWIVVMDSIVLWHIIDTILSRDRIYQRGEAPVPADNTSSQRGEESVPDDDTSSSQHREESVPGDDTSSQGEELVPDGDSSSSDGEESAPDDRKDIFEYEKLVPDIFMLENQIPAILVLKSRKVLRITSDTKLRDNFYNFCEKYSPLKLTTDNKEREAAFDMNSHILHFMYQLIMLTHDVEESSHSKDESSHSNAEGLTGPRNAEGPTSFKELAKSYYNKLKIHADVAADHAAEVYCHVVDEFSSAMDKAEDAGIKGTGSIRKVSQLLLKVERTLQLQQQNSKSQVFPGDDKIEIPSVSRLVLILNVIFKPLHDDGITSIKLIKTQDGKGFEFYLPVLKLRPSSEVIIRNLVAYEATMCKDPLPGGSTRFREFVDLMCGLIRSEKDVQLLKDAGIIETGGEFQDQQIVDMCSGIRRSDEKPEDGSKVHTTVKDANDHFNNTRFVKFWKGFMKAVSIMVKMFRLLFPFLIIAFFGFQSACQVFDCRVGSSRVAATNYLYFDDPQAPLLPRKLLPY